MPLNFLNGTFILLASITNVLKQPSWVKFETFESTEERCLRQEKRCLKRQSYTLNKMLATEIVQHHIDLAEDMLVAAGVLYYPDEFQANVIEPTVQQDIFQDAANVPEQGMFQDDEIEQVDGGEMRELGEFYFKPMQAFQERDKAIKCAHQRAKCINDSMLQNVKYRRKKNKSKSHAPQSRMFHKRR